MENRMKLKTTLIAMAVAAATLLAQGPGGRGFGPGPDRQPDFSEIKTYLGLSDAQLASLQQLNQQQRQSMQQLAQQIQQRSNSLRQLLQASTADPAAVGRTVLEIEALRKQANTAQTNLRNASVNVLSADQRAKLKVLEDAAKLRGETAQAAMLHLLTPPEDGFRNRAPAFFGPGLGPGFRGPEGPGRFGRPPMGQ
jgi:Spy/CpxP family protein refolding chaperone